MRGNTAIVMVMACACAYSCRAEICATVAVVSRVICV